MNKKKSPEQLLQQSIQLTENLCKQVRCEHFPMGKECKGKCFIFALAESCAFHYELGFNVPLQSKIEAIQTREAEFVRYVQEKLPVW